MELVEKEKEYINASHFDQLAPPQVKMGAALPYMSFVSLVNLKGDTSQTSQKNDEASAGAATGAWGGGCRKKR